MHIGFILYGTLENVELSEFVFPLHILIIYLFFMHLCGRIICFRYFAKKNQLNEPLLGNYSEDEEEND